MNIEKTASEVSKPSKETQLGFNPDRLMGRETKAAKSEVKTTETGKLIDFDKFITRSTDKFELRDLPSTYKERYNRTPINGLRGQWSGERGESEYKSTNPEANAALSEFGLSGIKYKNSIPDFRPVSAAIVKIEGMSADRSSRTDENGNHFEGNYEKANIKCAEQWNKDRRDGKDDWTPSDVEKWRKAHNYTWHEHNDMETCVLVPTIINKVFTHFGGVGETNKKNNRNGGFDD